MRLPAPWGGSPAGHVLVLVVDGQAGDLALHFPHSRLDSHVGAEQQSAKHIPDSMSQEDQGRGVEQEKRHFRMGGGIKVYSTME